MKIALLGDVHGNLPALEAVLADAAGAGAGEIWNVGDSVGYGPFPDECVRRLAGCCAVNILGNYDRKVLAFPQKAEKWRQSKAPVKFEAFRWAWEHLSDAGRRTLGSWPGRARRRVGGWDVLAVHGSPDRDDEPLTDATPARRLEELAAAAAGAEAVVCGHAHVPMLRRVGGVLFVGTGSVGRPEGDPRACYAILDVEGGRLLAAHRRVPYDVEATAAAIRRAGLPEEFAEMLRSGKNLDAVRDAAAEARREHLLRAVEALGDRHGVMWEHARQVTQLALRLFDELGELHGLGPTERLWLQCAAMLHDIGLVDGRQGHHKTAQRLILADGGLPLEPPARQIVAAVTRYHRKALPAEHHEPYGSLDAAGREAVCMLAGILRVADGLDRTHIGAITDVTCRFDDRRVTIRGLAADRAYGERWAATKKADLLARATGRAVEIEIVERT